VSDTPAAAGDAVEVVKVVGLKLYVRPVKGGSEQ
jgi:membrane protein implicated in regulation of membrane protease activity